MAAYSAGLLRERFQRTYEDEQVVVFRDIQPKAAVICS